MQTITCIGSDKNAGKTTTLHFIYNHLSRSYPHLKIGLTSIGMNGEKTDQYDQHLKPSIPLSPDHFFVTSEEHLLSWSGHYELIAHFGKPHFKKNYILAKPFHWFTTILEGPNEKEELIKLKKEVVKKKYFDLLLVDGSIDRHFLGHPDISDSIYYSLLISGRLPQQLKAKQLLTPLTFPLCTSFVKEKIESVTDFKSVLLSEEGKVLYKGQEIPFLDKKLHHICLEKVTQRPHYLYLNGALSKGLSQFLAPFRFLTIILNNFTLYQNIQMVQKVDQSFLPMLELLYPIPLKGLFLREEGHLGHLFRANLPKVPLYNLFREDADAIRISL